LERFSILVQPPRRCRNFCGCYGETELGKMQWHPRLPHSNFVTWSFLVALFAIELDADPALPALRGRHPRTLLPRRLMADVLRVSALKLGHPVGVLILMEADDFLFHRWRARRGLSR
jgi:hypothetical protein